jgi:endonuclease G
LNRFLIKANDEGMKTFDRFIEQIEKTKQRLLLTSVNEPGVVKSAIHPTQVNKYLKEHNLNITELINDRLLRERVIKGDDTLDINYLERGVIASRAVCRININSAEGEEGFGTGFLIAPQVLITNNHVLPNVNYIENSYAEFNYQKGIDDLPLPVSIFRFNPSKLFYTNEELDYSIVWVDAESAEGTSFLQDFGYLVLNPHLGKTKEGNYVSIIQHPDGKIKKVALRQNEVTNLSLPKFIRYVTDTKSGSSGAPVFNDKWEVVAVHHAGIPSYNKDGKILNLAGEIWDRSQGEVQVNWIENEGVRVSSIVYDMTTVAAKAFPFLLDLFEPLTDIEEIRKSMGINAGDLQNDTYYSEKLDGENKNHYYRDIKDPSLASFTDLHTLLEETHTSPHNYNPSKYVYPKVDLHPDGLLRSIYSNKEFTIQELILADQKVDIERQLQFIELAKNENLIGHAAFDGEVEKIEKSLPYNCEHVICQSWFNKQEPMRGDLHHLFACESGCNSFRSDFPYFDFPDYNPQPATANKVQPSCGNVENELFEPENNKGIVARAVFYFLVRYPGAIKVYQKKDIDTLKDWAAKQAVTLYEKHRNHEIFLLQGNRNPFIDFPELVQTLTINL